MILLQQALTTELAPFIASGCHVIQKECYPSSLCTFVEGISRCNPPISIKP